MGLLALGTIILRCSSIINTCRNHIVHHFCPSWPKTFMFGLCSPIASLLHSCSIYRTHFESVQYPWDTIPSNRIHSRSTNAVLPHSSCSSSRSSKSPSTSIMLFKVERVSRYSMLFSHHTWWLRLHDAIVKIRNLIKYATEIHISRISTYQNSYVSHITLNQFEMTKMISESIIVEETFLYSSKLPYPPVIFASYPVSYLNLPLPNVSYRIISQHFTILNLSLP